MRWPRQQKRDFNRLNITTVGHCVLAIVSAAVMVHNHWLQIGDKGARRGKHDDWVQFSEKHLYNLSHNVSSDIKVFFNGLFEHIAELPSKST